jgi:hypothetical protein
MPEPIILQLGNTPLVKATLTDFNGAPVNLTGASIEFAWQQRMGPVLIQGMADNIPYGFLHAASIVNAAVGQVSYQFATGETAIAGDYLAQWQVTPSGGAPMQVYPVEGATKFRIVTPLPRSSPNNIVAITQMRDPVRCCLGDNSDRFRKYSDEAIDRTVRTCLMVGKVPCQKLGADRISITPGIMSPHDCALLMYHASKMFLMPESGDYMYRLRGVQERFGRQDLFVRELENQLYYLENGEMFKSFQSFYAWVNALTGIDIWSLMSDMKTDAPVASVEIGRAGVVVATI